LQKRSIHFYPATADRLRGKTLNPAPASDRTKRVFEPIRNQKDIKLIRSGLKDNPRNLLLFDLAVETGVGIKKLLQLKVKHLMGVAAGKEIAVLKNISGKSSCVLTETVHQTFCRYLAQLSPKPDEYLFKSKKNNHPLKLSSVSNMIKGWFSSANIKGSYGAVSLRKTWEYHHANETGQDKAANTSSLETLFAPIQTTSAQQMIYNKLIAAIISGKIPPGTRLTTSEISKSFNVSHAPVRVAMNWLEAKGFIEAQKKRGSIVKELSVAELHEIIKVRIILETAAMELSYKVCTEKTLETLTAIIKKYSQLHQKGAAFEETDPLNREFHLTLYRDAGMPLLVKLIADLYDRFSPYAAISYRGTGVIPEHGRDKLPVEYYHEKIVAGLRSRKLKEILKHLKTKIDRATLITEEILKKKKESRQE
jgi:DNA-binding GntR family transcriptional regulator